MLHLINFDDPFGFSVVEAMACGTPVVAYVRGSMTELINDGENGYLVHTVDQAVVAVHVAGDLYRMAVRGSVVDRFDVGRMVDEYITVYRRAIDLHSRDGAGRLSAREPR